MLRKIRTDICENCNHSEPHETVFTGVDEWDDCCTHIDKKTKYKCMCKTYHAKVKVIEMSVKDYAEELARKKKQEKIDEARIKKENEEFRAKEHKQWVKKLQEIIKPLNDDFKIVYEKMPATWFILNKNVPKDAREKLYLLKVKLSWHTGKTRYYDEGDLESYAHWGVEIFQRNSSGYWCGRKDERKEQEVYYTNNLDELDTKFSEKLAERMAEFY